MSRTSPMQRSLAELRAKGYTVAVTERWNAYAKIRQDLLGFCDVLALAPGAGIVAVQTTSASHLAHRRTKILAEPRALVWLQSGGRIVLHGWRKKGRNWLCRQEEIVAADFAEAVT